MKTQEKYEKYKPKKFFGQNFLVDDNISKKIIKQLEIQDDDVIVEIGPGQGALTKHLVNEAKRYFAVEIDTGIADKLENDYGGSVKIIRGDFLKFNLQKDIKLNRGERLKIIGNIPYNITSEILFKLFDVSNIVKCAVLMVQREVARRLIAKPNTKDYGILAVQTQMNCIPKLLFDVPPTSFFPKPNVHSSVIKLDFSEKIYEVMSGTVFTQLVRSAFGKRRKVMSNSLKEFFIENNIDKADIDFDFTRRPENLSVPEFVQLSNELTAVIDK